MRPGGGTAADPGRQLQPPPWEIQAGLIPFNRVARMGRLAAEVVPHLSS